MPAGAGIVVPFVELGTRGGPGSSPTENFENNGGRASRKIQCAWNDRVDLVWQALGYSSTRPNPGGSGNVLSRWLPERHPDYPWLVCTSVSDIHGVHWQAKAEDTATGGPINEFEFAHLTLNYSAPPYLVRADSDVTSETQRYVTADMRQGQTFTSLPLGSLLWAAGPYANQPVGVNVGVSQPFLELRLRWWLLPDDGLPVQTIQDTVGCVNSDTFTVEGVGECPPGSLLLTGAEYHRNYLPYGEGGDVARGWDVVYVMRYRKELHTNIFTADPTNRGAAAGYYQLTKNGPPAIPVATAPDFTLLYSVRPFANLFRVP